jgi:hypothetical protein
MNSTFDNVAHVEEQRPRSATPFSVGLLGIVVGLLTLWLLRDSTALDGAGRSTAACLAIIATIAAYELFVARVYLRPSAGLTGQAVRPLSVARVGLRLAALASVYAGIGLLYWLLPEYHGTFYKPFWSLIGTLAPYLIVAAPFYFAWMDRRQRETDDAYMAWGRLVFRGQRPANWKPVREMLAGWMVKAFFLPLMITYLSTDADHIGASLVNAMNAPFSLATFRFMYDLHDGPDVRHGRVSVHTAHSRYPRAQRGADHARLAGCDCLLPAVLVADLEPVHPLRGLALLGQLADIRTHCPNHLGRRDYRPRLLLRAFHHRVRIAVFEPDQSRHHHLGPLSLHEASRLHHEESFVLDGLGAVHRTVGLATRAPALLRTGMRESAVLHARQNRGTASDERSRLSGLR